MKLKKIKTFREKEGSNMENKNIKVRCEEIPRWGYLYLKSKYAGLNFVCSVPLQH